MSHRQPFVDKDSEVALRLSQDQGTLQRRESQGDVALRLVSERLQKILARAGVASRRAAEQLIADATPSLKLRHEAQIAYRKALAHKVAMEELKRCSGTQFDPAVAEDLSPLARRAEQ